MLRASELAPGLFVAEDVALPEDVQIGANVVIHPGTAIGSGVTIQDGAVLGKPPALGSRSTARRDPPPPLVVEDGAVVCAGAVICAGAVVGPEAVIGDQAYLRERVIVGAGSVVGRGTAIENDVTIGSGVRIQTGCYITAFSEIEDDVFVAPCVATSNDMTAGRRRGGEQLLGARLRRACRVGAGAVLLPDIEVGEEAFVGAGSVVTRDVAPRTVVVGVPARVLRDTADEELLGT